MATSTTTSGPRSAAQHIRRRIERSADRLWRPSDFPSLPPDAVIKTFSRLQKAGLLRRLSKGIYYRAKGTRFGPSRPNPARIQQLAQDQARVFPAGTSAANLLGFSTQAPKEPELATDGLSLPRKLVGDNAIIHTRRPQSWARLSKEDAALLDMLRQGGKASDLSPAQTIERTLKLLAEDHRFDRLLKIANDEPPRVRALLGALGQAMGRRETDLAKLRRSLNPLSRFAFGLYADLPHAKEWQAKQPTRKGPSR